jgi:hypothetical protein
MQRKLAELERELKEALEASASVEGARQFTEFQRVLADLKTRFGKLVEAGVAFAAAVLDAIEAAASDVWRWLSA